MMYNMSVGEIALKHINFFILIGQVEAVNASVHMVHARMYTIQESLAPLINPFTYLKFLSILFFIPPWGD